MKLNKINKVILSILAVIPFVMVLALDFPTKSSNDCVVLGSFELFGYEELKDASNVIALVEVVDDLTAENSVVNYLEDNVTISGFYGVREVKVLNYYKNDLNLGEDIEIIEPAIVTESNQYLHIEEYQAMENGNQYIVFLSNETASGELSVLSGNNGLINVTDFSNNEFYDILVKAVLDLEVPQNVLPNTYTDVVLSAKEVALEDESHLTEEDTNLLETTVQTNFGEVEVTVYHDSDLQKDVVELNGVTLVINE